MKLKDDPIARAKVFSDAELFAQTLSGQAPPNDRELEIYWEVLADTTKSEDTYSHSRSKQDIAIKLGTSASKLSKIISGKEILDIGCGSGKFATEVAKDKSNIVTALDSDAELLDMIPARQNLTAVHGDGYNLGASGISGDSFDAVFINYSTNFWAKSTEEIALSFHESLRVLRPGGSLFYTPVAQNCGINEANLNNLFSPMARKLGMMPSLEYSKVHGFFALATLGIVQLIESSDEVNVAFRESTKNQTFTPKYLPGDRVVTPDSYSAVFTRLTE